MILNLVFTHKLKQKHLSGAHKHPYYELILSFGSGGYIKTPAGQMFYKKDDIIIHPPNSSHDCSNDTECVHYCVGVTGLELKGLGDCVVNPDKQMVEIFFKLAKELEKSSKYQEKVMSLMAEELVFRILRSREKKTDYGGNVIENVKTLLDQNYKSGMDLDHLSKKVFLSKDYIRHSFKKEYGISPIQYLIQKRIESAKEMLQVTDKTASEIAFLLGFSDEFYFSRLFKKVTGESPLKFRKTTKK